MNFDLAFEKLIGHEGGYVNDARDPGGETKYGISKRAYPNEDIKNLTLERAKQIYRRDYWDAVKAYNMPDAVRMPLFDAAVNSGVKQAVKWLQTAAKAEPDGIIGPKTMLAVRMADPHLLARRFLGLRLRFMTDTRVWATYSRGWARRIADNLLGA